MYTLINGNKHIYIHIYIYIYIYIERERERDRYVYKYTQKISWNTFTHREIITISEIGNHTHTQRI